MKRRDETSVDEMEYELWEAWWMSLPQAERDREIALMDAHAAEQSNRGY